MLAQEAGADLRAPARRSRAPRVALWLTALLSSRWALTGVLLAGAAVYASTLNDWFSGDDFWFLRSAQTYSVTEYAAKVFDFREAGNLPELNRYHPLHLMTWRLMYGIFGMNALPYHATFLALHLGCAVLVWLLAQRLLRTTWAANLAALIFVLHPAYTDDVTWITGGSRLLATGAFLLSLLLFAASLDGGRWRFAAYGGALLAYIASFLFHSVAVVLPALLPLYLFLVAREPRDALRPRSWLPVLPFLAIAAAQLAVLFSVSDRLHLDRQIEAGWHQYGSYGRYLGLSLVPVLSRDLDDLSDAAVSWIDGVQQVASLALILISIALLLRQERRGVALFVVSWLFAALFLDSLLTYKIIGRYLYLPGAALAILLALAAVSVRDLLPQHARRPAAWAAVLLIAALLVPAGYLAHGHAQFPGDNAREDEAFVAQLREQIPHLAPGSILYVKHAPDNLKAYDDSRLQALVELYYPGVQARAARLSDTRATPEELGAVVFRFEP